MEVVVGYKEELVFPSVVVVVEKHSNQKVLADLGRLKNLKVELKSYLKIIINPKQNLI